MTMISNSFCPSYTSYSTYVAISAYLRKKVQREWGAWNNQLFFRNFAIYSPI